MWQNAKYSQMSVGLNQQTNKITSPQSKKNILNISYLFLKTIGFLKLLRLSMKRKTETCHCYENVVDFQTLSTFLVIAPKTNNG